MTKPTKPKRPYNMQDGKRRNVYADEQTWQAVKAKGGGNASQGIREYVREEKERGDG